jgi:N-acylneuraminate cytidylyltransferase
MIENNYKVLAVITARGGSKGLVRKNVLYLAGFPLISWTIKAAQKSKYITKVILSSDDDEIITVAKEYGCEVPFRRPEELATDNAASSEVIFHALEKVPGYDYVVVLQPTSPLRSSVDIDLAFELMVSSEADSCVSVCETAKTPYWMYHLESDKKLTPLLSLPLSSHRRQILPATYELNGAIYILKTSALSTEASLVPEGAIAYVMDRAESIDIDTLSDFKKCHTYLEEKSNDAT